MKRDEPVKTIAILGTLPPIRGLSSYCLEFATALSTRFTVEFISFKNIYPAFLYPGGNLEEDQTYPAIKRTAIHVRRCLNWYNPFSWITEGAFTKADLLHAQWWSLPLFPIYLVICLWFKLRGKPVIFTVHNVLPHERSLLFVKLSHLLFSVGDHFIVHSNMSRRQMMIHYHIPQERISVIPHGSLDFYVRSRVDSRELRREMGFFENDKIILLFGAIREYKGIDVAIKALPEIVRHIPKARLLVAGKLWEDWTPYDHLIQQLKLSDYVSLHLEYIPSNQVYKYFEIADLAIFPYRRFGGQSGAGSAAIAFRKPMIVSNVGGLPDLVADARCIVPPGNHSALARAVVDGLKHPNIIEQMTSDAECISNKFSWVNIADKTAEIYRKRLNPK